MGISKQWNSSHVCVLDQSLGIQLSSYGNTLFFANTLRISASHVSGNTLYSFVKRTVCRYGYYQNC